MSLLSQESSLLNICQGLKMGTDQQAPPSLSGASHPQGSQCPLDRWPGLTCSDSAAPSRTCYSLPLNPAHHKAPYTSPHIAGFEKQCTGCLICVLLTGTWLQTCPSLCRNWGNCLSPRPWSLALERRMTLGSLPHTHSGTEIQE